MYPKSIPMVKHPIYSEVLLVFPLISLPLPGPHRWWVEKVGFTKNPRLIKTNIKIINKYTQCLLIDALLLD